MKGTVNKIGREKGAFYGLIDFVLQSLIGSFDNFDFVGSNDKGVSDFYRKFGAKDFNYSILKYNKKELVIDNLINKDRHLIYHSDLVCLNPIFLNKQKLFVKARAKLKQSFKFE